MSPVLVLIGSPGAGKTTVGRRVAERLKVAFADSDHAIEARTGLSASDIFVTQGEDEFRRIEAEVIAELIDGHDGVLALGGGAVLRPQTREALADQQVVWLKVGVPDAARRVGLNTARPLLLGNVRSTLTSLLEQRNPVYEQVATDVVETSGRSLRQVTDAVVAVVANA